MDFPDPGGSRDRRRSPRHLANSSCTRRKWRVPASIRCRCTYRRRMRANRRGCRPTIRSCCRPGMREKTYHHSRFREQAWARKISPDPIVVCASGNRGGLWHCRRRLDHGVDAARIGDVPAAVQGYGQHDGRRPDHRHGMVAARGSGAMVRRARGQHQRRDVVFGAVGHAAAVPPTRGGSRVGSWRWRRGRSTPQQRADLTTGALSAMQLRALWSDRLPLRAQRCNLRRVRTSFAGDCFAALAMAGDGCAPTVGVGAPGIRPVHPRACAAIR